MALSTRSAVLPRALLAMAAACALRWCFQGQAFAGATAAPRVAPQRGGRVAMAGAAQDGIFTPVVGVLKVVMGEDELKKLRGQVIKAHGEVMGNFIDTADTRFGEWTLRRLFGAADKDGNGELDRDELRAAMQRLGFGWMEDEKKIEQLLKKGDQDGNGLIDFDEFKKMAPTALKQNLLKLAKQNGAQLGMLS